MDYTQGDIGPESTAAFLERAWADYQNFAPTEQGMNWRDVATAAGVSYVEAVVDHLSWSSSPHEYGLMRHVDDVYEAAGELTATELTPPTPNRRNFMGEEFFVGRSNLMEVMRQAQSFALQSSNQRVRPLVAINKAGTVYDLYDFSTARSYVRSAARVMDGGFPLNTSQPSIAQAIEVGVHNPDLPEQKEIVMASNTIHYSTKNNHNEITSRYMEPHMHGSAPGESFRTRVTGSDDDPSETGAYLVDTIAGMNAFFDSTRFFDGNRAALHGLRNLYRAFAEQPEFAESVIDAGFRLGKPFVGAVSLALSDIVQSEFFLTWEPIEGVSDEPFFTYDPQPGLPGIAHAERISVSELDALIAALALNLDGQLGGQELWTATNLAGAAESRRQSASYRLVFRAENAAQLAGVKA